MAVAAAHIALGEFCNDRCHRAGVDQPAHIVALGRGISVVELEHHRIGLAAVDARMRAEVFRD
jgi:hypothetical protein